MNDDKIARVRAVLDAAEDVDLPEGIVAPQDQGSPDPGEPCGDGMDPGVPPPPPPEEDDGFEWEKIGEASAEPLNDFGNGRRFVIHFGADMISVPRVGVYLWDQTRWRKDPDNVEVRRNAHKMGELIARETIFLNVPDQHRAMVDGRDKLQERMDELDALEKQSPEEKAERKQLKADMALIDKLLGQVQDLRGQRLRHAKNAGNSGPLDHMIDEACIIRSRDLDQMDADPMLFNTRTGTIRFTVERIDKFKRAGFEVLAHDRDHLISKIGNVDYDADAKAEKFQAFLTQIMPSIDVQKFLQRIFGLCLLGLREQALFYFWGDGANGKSTLVNAVADVLGDYSATTKIETFTGTNRRSAGDATPELVPVIGARMLQASEPDQGVTWQESLIKAMTGGTPMLIRPLNKDFVEVTPFFKPIIDGNYRPEFKGTDDGIWRRLKLVQFPVQIPEADRLPQEELNARLASEKSGILNWMIEGALNYLEGGLMVPDEVRGATQDLREESDPFGTFLDDACHIYGGDTFIPAGELVHAFQFWLARHGEGYMGDQKVSKALADRARRWRSRKTGQKFARVKVTGVYRYIGITFTDAFRTDWQNTPKDARGRPLNTGPSAGPGTALSGDRDDD